MLSREDSRRLAQMERQLRRDDPDFCARMSGGLETSTRKRTSLPLILTASAVGITAIILGVTGRWIAAVVAAVWATVTVATLAYRVARRRSAAR